MSYFLATATFTIFGVFVWYLRRSRRSIAYLPGPPPGSWLVGNLPSFARPENAADADFQWTKEYGNAFRYKGCFGEDVLFLSDPKAMQYILNTSGYNFPKTWDGRVRQKLFTGLGILSVEGAQHARHRRVMNPSFSHSALKGFLPLFFDISRKTTAVLKAMIRKQNSEASVIDVSPLLTRTTLDAIGEAAFGYSFNAVEDAEPKTELHEKYQNLFVDAHYMISDLNIAFRRLLGYAPLWLSDLLTYLPKKDLKRVNNYMHVARQVAKGLVEKQMRHHSSGKEGGKDVMSIFVKANNAEDPKRRLEGDEIVSQITTLLLAGHETTANTLGWVFYELAKHPDVQHKLRDEVKAVRAEVASRGDSEITIADMDSMTYTLAIMKETLRYHPIVVQLARRAGHDDVIPLATPQRTAAGDTTTAIPVREGQVVQLGLAAYNRLKSVWGDDADQWRPERFLGELPNDKKKVNLGVFGNLATFSSGLRSCIGWRFSVIEMQAILIEIIDNFEFNPVPGVEMKHAASIVVQSIVKGQEEKGTQMPLTVSIVSD